MYIYGENTFINNTSFRLYNAGCTGTHLDGKGKQENDMVH
jgi:hypothetical protein